MAIVRNQFLADLFVGKHQKLLIFNQNNLIFKHKSERNLCFMPNTISSGIEEIWLDSYKRKQANPFYLREIIVLASLPP